MLVGKWVAEFRRYSKPDLDKDSRLTDMNAIAEAPRLASPKGTMALKVRAIDQLLDASWWLRASGCRSIYPRNRKYARAAQLSAGEIASVIWLSTLPDALNLRTPQVFACAP